MLILVKRQCWFGLGQLQRKERCIKVDQQSLGYGYGQQGIGEHGKESQVSLDGSLKPPAGVCGTRRGEGSGGWSPWTEASARPRAEASSLPPEFMDLTK